MRKTEVLTDETKVLGVPVKEWNKAFIGNFEKSLAEMKRGVEQVKDETSLHSPAKSSAIDGKK